MGNLRSAQARDVYISSGPPEPAAAAAAAAAWWEPTFTQHGFRCVVQDCSPDRQPRSDSHTCWWP